MMVMVGNEDEVREWLKVDIIVKLNWKKVYCFYVFYLKFEEKDEEFVREFSVFFDIVVCFRVLWEIVERYGKVLIFINIC